MSEQNSAGQVFPPQQNAAAYLGVSRSPSGKIWQLRLTAADENAALHSAQKYGLSEALARILVARNVPAAAAADFLNPSLRQLMPEPYSLHNMERAAKRLAQACLQREKIAVFADYDADGACSAALLLRFLTALDNEARLYIPDREKEGYGPNAEAMRSLALAGASLIITADCGANSEAALAAGRQAGADILVLDHHPPAPRAAKAEHAAAADYIQVNPNQPEDSSGLGYLCAAGVVYMSLAATARLLRGKMAHLPDLLELLDLVALATICDIVPLQGLNRAFVKKGLLVAHQQRNIGLKALAQAARINEPLNPYHFGYILGPRINAGGRIGDAALGAKLLTAASAEQAQQIAAQLDSLNYGRQEIEAAQLGEALAQAEADMAADKACPLLFACGDWHIGIVGLLAARLKERFEKPAFVMAVLKNGQATGSARSVPGLDIGRLVARAVAEGLLLRGGGHKMAAGFSLKAENIPLFRRRLRELLREREQEEKQTVLWLDGSLSARGATVDLVEELEQAGPFGAGNPQPLFAFPNHKLAYIQTMGKDNAHLRLILEDGQGGRLQGAAFRAAGTELGQFLLGAQGRQAHFAGSLSLNHWQGQTTPQLRIIDAAEAG